MIDRLATNLLRRHVAGRSEHRARRSAGLGVRLHRGPVAQRRTVRGEPEIEHFDLRTRRNKDVLRLQIAMHDAARVRRVERPADLPGVLERFPPRQPTVRERLAQ